jgi:hypothetical protein
VKPNIMFVMVASNAKATTQTNGLKDMDACLLNK